MMLDEIVKNTVEAIAKGRTDVILALIDTYGKTSSESNGNEYFSLKKLLDSSITEDGTLLHYATQLNQTDIARTLMLAGADPSLRNEQKKSCFDLAETDEMQIVYLHELMRVIALSCVSKVAQLLESGFDVNSQKHIVTRDAPLHWAATYSDFNTLCFLLDKGADPNAVNCYGATPLHDAIVRGEPDIIEELLRHGANPNIKPISGKYLEKFCSSMTDSDSFVYPVRDDECDLDRISDSSSSWINAGGSHDSLTVACPTEILQPSDFNDDKLRDFALTTDYEPKVPSSMTAGLNEASHGCSNEFREMYKLIWPKPRRIHLINGEEFTLSKDISVYIVESQNSSSETQTHKMLNAWEAHAKSLVNQDLSFQYKGLCFPGEVPIGERAVVFHINGKLFPFKDAFTISITSSQINIVSSDFSSFYYAISFLVKFIHLFGNRNKIPSIKVTDWPKWKIRGWMLDITLNKPSLKFTSITREIELASSFRFNHILLHTTLSQSFLNGDQDYLTAQNILNLEKCCDEKCVTLTPSIDLYPTSNRLNDIDIVRSIRSYLKKFSNHGYVFIGPNLTRYILLNNLGLMNVFSSSCLILDVCLLDVNLQWLHRLPLNAILLTSSWNNDFCSSSYLVKQKLTQLGYAINVSVPCVLENSITGCSNEVLSIVHKSAKVGQSLENVVFIMSGILKPSKYHMMRTFYLPTMAFAGGIAWNPDFHCDNIENFTTSILNLYVFDNWQGFGEVIMELCRVEANLRYKSNVEVVSILYELISNPDNARLEVMNVEKVQKAVRDLKLSVGGFASDTIGDSFKQIAFEEIQLVADLILFCLRLCRHLLSAGQNPNFHFGQSTSELPVINLGLSNLPPPIRTDLANKLLEFMRRFRQVNLKSHMSHGLEQEGQPFFSIFQQLIAPNLPKDVLDV